MTTNHSENIRNSPPMFEEDLIISEPIHSQFHQDLMNPMIPQISINKIQTSLLGTSSSRYEILSTSKIEFVTTCKQCEEILMNSLDKSSSHYQTFNDSVQTSPSCNKKLKASPKISERMCTTVLCDKTTSVTDLEAMPKLSSTPKSTDYWMNLIDEQSKLINESFCTVHQQWYVYLKSIRSYKLFVFGNL